MDPYRAPNAPYAIPTYEPYFYQSGIRMPYASRHGYSPQSMSRTASMPYEFAENRPATRRREGLQTVEQIIQHGYLSVPHAEPTMAIIGDKAFTSSLGLDDVITQIRRRYEIYGRNMYQIDLSVCSAVNTIYHHEAYVGPGTASSKQHYAKHKAIQDLYEEKRLERVNLWKDVSRLRTLLPENAQAYLASHRKLAILRTEPGESE